MESKKYWLAWNLKILLGMESENVSCCDWQIANQVQLWRGRVEGWSRILPEYKLELWYIDDGSNFKCITFYKQVVELIRFELFNHLIHITLNIYPFNYYISRLLLSPRKQKKSLHMRKGAGWASALPTRPSCSWSAKACRSTWQAWTTWKLLWHCNRWFVICKIWEKFLGYVTLQSLVCDWLDVGEVCRQTPPISHPLLEWLYISDYLSHFSLTFLII